MNGGLWLLPLLLAGSADGSRAADDWRLLDGVALQAGDEILTLSEFQRFVEDKLKDRVISSREELDQEIQGMLAVSITLTLEAQAGEDMGIDPQQVDRLVQFSQEERRRQFGVQGYVDYLEDRGLSGLTVEEGETTTLYQWLWRDRMTGKPGPGGTRPIRDRFIRPGTLRATYQANDDDLGTPPRVRLQVLDLPVAAAGSVEHARTLIGEIEERIAGGEDFGELVLEFGASYRESLGVTDLIPLPALRAEEALHAFAEQAVVGQLSGILPILREGETVGFRIARMHSREEGEPAPPFTDRRVQRLLRQHIEENREQGQLGRARRDLQRRAYVWRNPALVPPESAQDPAPGL